jgi:DNA-binding transcriptional ArsR family regulator
MKKSNRRSESDRDIVRILLFKDLNNADIAILSAVSRLSQTCRMYPNATMIMNELSTLYPLKSTQVYDHLSRLKEMGFVSIDPFKRPRSYRIDVSTILSGSKEWLHRKKQDLAKASKGIEDALRTFEETSPIDVAQIVDEAVQNNSVCNK